MGRKLIKEEQLVTDIVVYKLQDDGLFACERQRAFKFSVASPHFCFDRYNNNQLLFFTKDEVFTWAYADEHAER